MKILKQLEHLDGLIIDHTKPPVTAKLRNYLSTIIEQAEAEGDLLDVIAKLNRSHEAEVLRIAKLYSEGKGILIPPEIIEKKKKKEDESR